MSLIISREILNTAWHVPLEEELKLNPDIKREDIDSVLQWCKDQPHLPQVSDYTAALFLLLSNYDISLAQTYIENHYTFRTYYRNMFEDRDPINKGITEASNLIHASILDGQCNDNCRVFFAKLKSTDSSKFNPKEFSKLTYMTLELDVMNRGFTKEGYKLLLDATGFGLGHLTSITPSFLKQLFSYFLDGANISIVEINIMNVNMFVEKLVFLIKAITPPIVYQRIKLYTKDKSEICLNKFPKETLPKEYGGFGKTLDELERINKEKLKQNRAWFQADEKYLRVDESKRPKDKQNKKVVKLQAATLQSLELD